MHSWQKTRAALRSLAEAARKPRGATEEALLDRAVGDLEQLNRSTERDFLSIGGKLAGLVDAARRISADMTALGEMMSDACGSRAPAVLTGILERCREAESRAEAGDAGLATICDRTRTAGRAFGGFRQTVSLFRVLGSLTRIETARLGSAGAEFGTLADEVNALTQRVESSGEGILESAAALYRDMQSALARLAAFRAGELKDLPSLLGEITGSLDTLRDRHQKAMEASLRQAAEYREISAAIEDLITALQFHDITRQQMEHVADALRRLRSTMRKDPPAVRRAVLKLQASQLSSARQAFVSSIERIDRNLGNVSLRIAGMAETGAALMGPSSAQQGSVFRQLETGLKTIAGLVARCACAEAEMRAAAARMESAVGRMRGALEEVRHIGISIRRTALNATLRAAQIGDSGQALHIIADVMQRLALSFAAMADDTDTSLGDMAEAAETLSSESSWMGEESEATGAMNPAFAELGSATERSFAQLERVAALNCRLQSEMNDLRAGLSANRLVTETIDRVNGLFEQLGMAGGNESAETAGTPHLDEFASRYTMAAEREVHAAVLAGENNPAAPPPDSAAGAGDLGDNIELF